MRTVYHFSITNRRKRYYTLLANIFLLFASGAFAFYRYMLYRQKECDSVVACIILPMAIFLVILFRFYFIFRRKDIMFTQLHLSMIVAACWLSGQQYVYAGIILLLGLFEYMVNRDTVCMIDENGVQLKAIPERKWPWKDIEQVMMKDGIFTVDRKDNHIFQTDVSGESLSFGEDEFNRFCASHRNIGT